MGIDQLREQLRCPVITSDDDGYDEARAVHNGMFDKRPPRWSEPSRPRT